MKQSNQNDRDERKNKQKPDGKSADGRNSGANDKHAEEDTRSSNGKAALDKHRDGQKQK